MKTLRIRKFMVIGMISVVIFPWFIYFIVHFINLTAFQNGSQRNQEKLNEVTNLIAANPGEWSNSGWQNKLRKQLKQAKIDAVILSPSNREIFKFGNWHQNQWMQSKEITVIENGQTSGTVKLNSHWQNDTIAGICAFTALLSGIFFVGFQMRRSVVNPLEAMSKAARRIAKGDLEIHLPVSHVTEIFDVRAGFEVMVAGLNESFQNQARLEEERRFFIGSVAHDLRTPLFALRGYLEGLELGIASSPEKMAKYVGICKEKTEQLNRLVADLFAFTKLEYMEQTTSLEKVDTSLILGKSIDSLKPLALERGISIIFGSPSGKEEDTVDPHLLERAVNNLLENALRYTPAGGEISVTLKKEPGKTVIEVRDTGPGFSPEDLHRVFHPLYRGESSRNRATGGAGLGLAIAKRIFQAHGGDLAAANGRNGGAVLTGWMPS
jgi:signal transduction histidine kinase